MATPAKSIQCRFVRLRCFIRFVFRHELRAARRCRKHKLKVSDSNRATFDCLQACSRQQRDDIPSANMSMRAVKVRQNGSFLITETLKVNDKDASIRFEYSSNFIRALQPGFLW